MQQAPRFLSRRDASEHLLSEHGLDIPPERLARFALNGRGPPFRLLAGRPASAVYTGSDLDAWAQHFVGPRIIRIADHPAHRFSSEAEVGM
jgi:hypothetical protein